MSTAVKVALWVVGSVVAVVLLAVGAFAWGLSGGWDGIRPQAQPEDRQVVRAREDGREPLAALAGPVEQELGGPLVRTADVDQCSHGQNNWKIQDGWTLQCVQASVIGGPAAHPTVQDAAADLDSRLQGLGWSPAPYGEMEVFASGDVAEARYERPDDPDVALVVEVSAPGSASPYVSLGRYGADWSQGDVQPVLDAVEAAPSVTVLAVVERTYFQDD